MHFSLALALAAVTAPIDAPMDASCPLPALRAVAEKLEILDPRESKYVFARPEDLKADLSLARRRWQEFHDAPPAGDWLRFPDREWLFEAKCDNRFYRHFLEERKKLRHEDWLDDAIADCDALYAIYDLAADARTEYYYLTIRRAALKKLREKIGPHLYYAGCLPSAVPVWPFRIVD